MIRNRLTILIGLVLVALVVAACGGGSVSQTTASAGDETSDTGSTEITASPSEADDSYDSVDENGTLRVGMVPTPGLMDIDPGSQEVTGLYAELLDAAVEPFGWDLEPHLVQWGALIPGLQSNQWDVALGLNVTAERCEQILFSDPVTAGRPSLAVEPGNPFGISSYQDIAAAPDFRLAVISGTVEEAFAVAAGVSNDQFVSVPDFPTGIDTLGAGRADGIGANFVDFATVVTDVEFEVFEDESLDPTGGGMAFAKDAVSLRDAINERLQVLKEDGTFEEIKNRHGFEAAPLGIELTLDDILEGCDEL